MPAEDGGREQQLIPLNTFQGPAVLITGLLIEAVAPSGWPLWASIFLVLLGVVHIVGTWIVLRDE